MSSDLVFVKERNREQLFALNLLFESEVPLVSITGLAGSGKTLMAIMAGLEQVLGMDNGLLCVGDNPDTWVVMDGGYFGSKVGPGWTIIGSDDGLGEVNLIRGNSRTIDENLTIPFTTLDQEGYAFENSCSVGPTITISSGFTVTVTEGVTYEII